MSTALVQVQALAMFPPELRNRTCAKSPLRVTRRIPMDKSTSIESSAAFTPAFSQEFLQCLSDYFDSMYFAN
jgi:hypothetical protein